MTLTTSTAAISSTVAIYGDQNMTNGSDCSEEPVSEWIVTVVPVYILLISVLGIVFNVFVLMVFCLHKKACTVAEIYLSNLAAADLVLVSCLPFWAVNVSKKYRWPFGLFLCKVVNLSINMNAYCSVYFLVLVSIDRFVALVYTMSLNRMRSPKYAKLGCLLVWGFGLLLSIPTLIYRAVGQSCNQTCCYLASETVYFLNEGVLTVFGFIIPFSIISFCTVKIIQALNSRLTEGLNSQKTDHKANTLVLAVLLAFFICWVPFHMARTAELLITAGVHHTVNLHILDICLNIFTYLAFFNSVLNPVLYVIVGKNFRKKVRELFQQWNSGVTFNMSSIRSNLTRSLKSSDL